jgi:predicted Fe-S protein YdhL (DUF1289 family)
MQAASPCTQNCAVHPTRPECTACGRTLAEITAWPTATEAEKTAILRRLAQQKKPI